MNNKGDILFVILVSLTVCCCLAQRQDPEQQAAKLQKTKQPVASNRNQSCSTPAEQAHLVEICAKPLMDILEGTIDKWPQNHEDVEKLCNSFAESEKCIRDVARRCTKGLHRTIVSTLANSVQRARKRECTKAKHPAILKTTQCMEKSQVPVHNLIANATSRLLVVETQMNNLEKKTNAVCCMVDEIEVQIKAIIDANCVPEAQMVIRLYRTVLEDVIELICHAPKCKDTFLGYKLPKPKYDLNVGIVAVVLRIVFSLGD